MSVSTGFQDLDYSSVFSTPFETIFTEGQYPVESTVLVEVSPDGFAWYESYMGVIQDMIETNEDLNMRGTALGQNGFAYLANGDSHNLFGPSCDQAPEEGYISIIAW